MDTNERARQYIGNVALSVLLCMLQELQWFLPKMMKTIISDCIITMQVYGSFLFSVVQPLLLDLEC